MTDKEAKDIRAYENGYVNIRLPKLPGQREQTDVIVSLNGRTWQIKRGIEVSVPRALKLILERARAAAEYADEYINAVAN